MKSQKNKPDYYKVNGSSVQKRGEEQADRELQELIDADWPLVSLLKQRGGPKAFVMITDRGISVGKSLIRIPTNLVRG